MSLREIPVIPNNTPLWGSSTSDVTIISGDKSFPCHRNVLAQGSDYFRILLLGSFRESSAVTVQLHEDNPDVLERLLKAMYGFPIENALDRYMAFQGISEWWIAGGDDESSVPYPHPHALAVAPWLREMLVLYFIARKYLCDDVCAVLAGDSGSFFDFAIDALFYNPVTVEADEQNKPNVDLIVELLQPVYEFVIFTRDPLRFEIAEAVAYYQAYEIDAQSTSDDSSGLRIPALLAALPDLEADLETVSRGRPDEVMRRARVRARQNEIRAASEAAIRNGH